MIVFQPVNVPVRAVKLAVQAAALGPRYSAIGFGKSFMESDSTFFAAQRPCFVPGKIAASDALMDPGMLPMLAHIDPRCSIVIWLCIGNAVCNHNERGYHYRGQDYLFHIQIPSID
jgi:hypothetical protein